MRSKDYSVEIGDSFLLKNQDGEHYHVIVDESMPGDYGSIMLIYLSSKDVPNKDTTTKLNPDECLGKFVINRHCWVRYQNTYTSSRIDTQNSILEHFGKVDSKLFDRITAGLLKSNKTPNYLKQRFHGWKMNKGFGDMK